MKPVAARFQVNTYHGTTMTATSAAPAQERQSNSRRASRVIAAWTSGKKASAAPFAFTKIAALETIANSRDQPTWRVWAKRPQHNAAVMIRTPSGVSIITESS
jgi:hypothetical protein